MIFKRAIIPVYIILLDLLSSQLIAQNISNKMNIEENITEFRNIAKFINSENFEDILSQKKQELLKETHYLSVYKFNKAAKSGKEYLLFDQPVKNINAYKNKSDYCLYLNIGYSKSIISGLISLLGLPDNELEENIDKEDFDFLYWGKNAGYDIWLGPSHQRGQNNITIKFTNMKSEDLVDKDSLKRSLGFFD